VKVSVEKLSTSEAVLDVDVTWDELEKASEKAYRKLVKQVVVSGFRPGKAPRSLVERKLGKEYIYQEGLEDLINDTYQAAMKEHKLVPVTQPKVDAPAFEMGQPYHFQVTVPIIMPPVLGDYRSLHFEREEAEVTSEEVEQEIESMRNRQATWQSVERGADYGDRVTMDLKLTVEEKSISDLKDNPFELTHQRQGLFVGMDEEVVGMQVGESKTFSTTIPADYTNEKLAGKQADYAVTLHKVEVKQLPELDDAFAAQVSQGKLETLEDLRKAVGDEILDNKEHRLRDELREKVLNAVIEQSQITLHPALIEEEAEEILHQFTHMLEQQHLSLDQYLKMTRQSREEYLESLKPDAEKRAKRQLVLDEVADKEEVNVAPEEIEALLRAYEQAGQALPRTEGQIRALAISYRREKALTKLVELTTDPDPDTISEEAETEAASAENAVTAAHVADELRESVTPEATTAESEQVVETVAAEVTAGEATIETQE
jgi:trigger factor